MLTAAQLLGRGVLQPLQRDEKNDFANADGVANVESCVRQVLGTRVGELRWRRAFGSRLYLLLHRSKNPALRDLAGYYAREALGRWEPRARLRTVRVRDGVERSLVVEVAFQVTTPDGRPVPGLRLGTATVAVGPAAG